MTTEIKRDLLADMVICDAATEGPWKYGGDKWGDLEVYSPSQRGFHNNGGCIAEIDEPDEIANAVFITEAREGWPDAIRRALAAEAKWDALKSQIYTDHNELQTCTLAMYELRRLIRLIERLETEGGNA